VIVQCLTVLRVTNRALSGASCECKVPWRNAIYRLVYPVIAGELRSVKLSSTFTRRVNSGKRLVNEYVRYMRGKVSVSFPKSSELAV